MIDYQVEIDRGQERFILQGDFEEGVIPIAIDINNPLRKKFIDLFLHKADVENGIDYLRCISVDKNIKLNEALFIAGLNNCMKCFKFSSSRGKLEKTVVFKDNQLMLSIFTEFETMRDKHFDHDESGMLQATAFLLISRADDHIWGGPPSVVWNRLVIDYYLESQRLQEIMQFVWKFICSEIDRIGDKIKECYEGISKEEILKCAAPQIALGAYGSKRE